MSRTHLQLLSAAAFAGTLLITLISFWGLIGFNGASLRLELLKDNYIQRILEFTLTQALLSTMGSILLAIPVARALHRLAPKGRALFLRLSMLAFVLPSLILITGIVNLLGAQSPFASVLGDWKLFGMNGILIAHIYLNFPLATRILYQSYQAIPISRERLSDQLKFTLWQRIKHLEWPAIRAQLASVSGLIFILCFNSFAIVLTLGGGPQATTLELAIYQALKYDFNLSEALTLAWLQFAIAGAIFWVLNYNARVSWLGSTRSSTVYRLERGWLSYPQYVIYWLAWVYLMAPLVSLLFALKPELMTTFPYAALLQSLLLSFAIGLSAATLALLTSIALLNPIRYAVLHRQRKRETSLSWLASHSLVAPAMVLSTGSYIWLLGRGSLEQYATLWLVMLNALILIPFILNQIRSRFIQFDAQYAQLSDQLKLSLRDRLRVTWPFVHRPIKASFALALLLALGDVSIFAIFGSYEYPTLPWLIYTFAGSYRMGEAAIASMVLLILCFVLLQILERNMHVDPKH